MSFVENSTTIGDIATWAAVGKLRRNNLLEVAVEHAADFYKLLTKKVPFDNLRATSSELPMVADQSTYNVGELLDDEGDAPLAGIVSVRLTTSTNRHRRLKRSHARVYDSLGSVSSSIPATYCRWGNNLEFNPPPSSSSYTFRLRYWKAVVLSEDVADTVLATPPEWDELIKWETLYRLYLHVGEYDKAQQLVFPVGATALPQRQRSVRKTPIFEVALIPRLWNDLLMTVDMREGIDEDFSINPVVRAYN